MRLRGRKMPVPGAGRWLALATMAAVVAGCQAQGSGGRRFLSIGTGGTGGIYYPLGGALASRLSMADSTHQYTAEVTGGSVENVNRIAGGEMDLGFAMATAAHLAFHGGPDYPEPVQSLRLVAPLYPNLAHLLIGRGAAIGSVDDFRGRRVSVGSAGSGTEQVARQILEAHGLDYDDVDARYLSFRESADALRDGAIDAAIIAAGYPAAAVLEVTTAGVASLLPIDDDRLKALESRYPYYSAGTIPAGSYPGVDADVPTITVMNWIVGMDTLDSTVVYELLDILRDQRAALQKVHNVAGQIGLDVLSRPPPIPLHPATIAWRDGMAR